MIDSPQPAASRPGRRLAVIVLVGLIGLAVSGSVAVARRTARPSNAAGGAGRGVVQVLHLQRAGRPSDVWVYRPPGADSATRPVLYFLHGLPGKPSDLFQAGLVAAMDRYVAAGGAPFVVAAPDGNSVSHADTEWGDASDGSDSLESFVTSTVIRAVEGDHPRAPGRRAIAGFLMGGYGAVNIAAGKPALFGQVVSLAGYFKLDDPSHMFATAAARAANTPTANLARLAAKRILLIQAAQEDESLVEGEAPRLQRLLAGAGIPATLITGAGPHGWQFVAAELPRVQRFLAAGWR